MATRDLCTRFGEMTGARSENPDRRTDVAAALAFSSEHGHVPGQDWA
jgi:hypothetical protein